MEIADKPRWETFLFWINPSAQGFQTFHDMSNRKAISSFFLATPIALAIMLSCTTRIIMLCSKGKERNDGAVQSWRLQGSAGSKYLLVSTLASIRVDQAFLNLNNRWHEVSTLMDQALSSLATSSTISYMSGQGLRINGYQAPPYLTRADTMDQIRPPQSGILYLFCHCSSSSYL